MAADAPNPIARAGDHHPRGGDPTQPVADSIQARSRPAPDFARLNLVGTSLIFVPALERHRYYTAGSAPARHGGAERARACP
jgi:hypothetical protein